METLIVNNNQYAVRFYYTFKDGKKKRVQITKKAWKVKDIKKKDFELLAVKAIDEKIKELERDREEEKAEESKLINYINDYIDFDMTINKETSCRAKKTRLVNYLGEYFGLNSDVTKIFDTKTISDFRLWLSKLDRGQETTSHIIMAVKQFLDYLVGQKVLDGSLVYSLKSLLVPIKKQDECLETEEVGENFWTKEEYDIFIKSFNDDDPYRFFFYCSFWLATRIGETIALKFSDFNKADGTVSIARQINTMGKITTTKTRGSKSKIAVPAHIFENLEKYKKLFGDVKPDDFVFFPTSYISRTTIRRKLYEHIESYSLKKITPHGFRHSMASYLLMNGFDYLDVSKYLRHSSPQITLSTYAHWIKKKDSKGFESLTE